MTITRQHPTNALPMCGFEEAFFKSTNPVNQLTALIERPKRSDLVFRMTDNQSPSPASILIRSGCYLIESYPHSAKIEVDVLSLYRDAFTDELAERAMERSGKNFADALRGIVASFMLEAGKAQAYGDITRPVFLKCPHHGGLSEALSGRWVDQEVNLMYANCLNNTASAEIVLSKWVKWSKTLNEFGKLEIGWDSYNALPPTKAAINNAQGFLEFLRKNWKGPSKLTPSVVGGVAFTFRNGRRSVYVEFRNTGNTHAAFTDDSSTTGVPEVIKVLQDTVGYSKLIAKAKSHINEQTAGCNED